MKKCLFFICCFFISISLFPQEKRLALVIGNSAYEYGGALRNPVNDAYAMNQALSKVGFEVLVYYNLDEGEMKRAIDEFGKKLNLYDIGLFFYAGHGIQARGKNYLVPVEANLSSEQQVEYDCVEADRVMSYMDASRADVNILILDACRDNPFEQSWSRSVKGKGLAFMNAPTGTLIAYATAPGSTASDGQGNNGLYTSAILENIMIPDITILQMFQNVRSAVAQNSYFEQTPWESTSLVGDFYFIEDDRPNLAPQEYAKESPKEYVKETEYDNTIAASANSFSGVSGTFIDIRDQQEYEWVRIGEQVWMSENLNFPTSEGSYCFKNETLNCEKYGRLYEWKIAMNICPEGWHLPKDDEWKVLIDFLSMEEFDADEVSTGYYGGNVGEALKAKYDWDKSGYGKNTSGFTALPGGIKSHHLSGFGQLKQYAFFWSGTEYKKKTAWYWILRYKNDKIARHTDSKSYSMNVRCLKDSEDQ